MDRPQTISAKDVALLHPSAFKHERRKLFQWYEEQIMSSFSNIGKLLMEMRADPLKPYLETHETFEEYCLQRWNIPIRRAQQKIEAEVVRASVVENCPELAPVLSRMKEEPLRLLGKSSEQERPEIVRKAVALAPKGVVTGTQILAAQGKPKPTKAKLEPVDAEFTAPETCPHCGQPMPKP